MKYLWTLLGLLCVGFALIGAVLPLIPTVPFLLLAAFFFAKSSERLHTWLITHRLFGSMILEWQNSGAIRPNAKKAATISIAAVFLFSLIMGVPTHVIAIQFMVLGGVLTFIWTRPNG